MKIYSLQLALFKNLSTAKENRLIFEEAPAAAPASAPASAPAAAPEATPEAPKAPEQIKEELTKKITAIEAKMKAITDDPEKKYTNTLKDAVTAKMEELSKIKEDLAKTDIKELDLKTFEEGVSDTLLARDIQLQSAKSKVSAKMTAFNESVKGKIKGLDDEANKKIKDFIGNTLTAQFIQFEKNVPTAESDQAKVDEYVKAVDAFVASFDPEKTADSYAKFITANPQAAEQLDALATKYKEARPTPELGKAMLTMLTEIYNSVEKGEKIDEKQMKAYAHSLEIAVEPDKAPANPEDAAKDAMYDAIAKIAGVEVLQLRTAIANYDVGDYKNPKTQSGYKDIIDKVIVHKDEIIAAGYRFEFFGGTDATKTMLKQNPEWHLQKARAFAKLLKFEYAGHLKLSKPLDASEIKLITDYVNAAFSNKAYDFLKIHPEKEKFLAGGGLFDKALALQRAEDRKMDMFKEQLDPVNEILNLEIGSTNHSEQERVAGFKFAKGALTEELNHIQGDPDALQQIERAPEVPMTPALKSKIEGTKPEEWKKDPKNPRFEFTPDGTIAREPLDGGKYRYWQIIDGKYSVIKDGADATGGGGALPGGGEAPGEKPAEQTPEAPNANNDLAKIFDAEYTKDGFRFKDSPPGYFLTPEEFEYAIGRKEVPEDYIKAKTTLPFFKFEPEDFHNDAQGQLTAYVDPLPNEEDENNFISIDYSLRTGKIEIGTISSGTLSKGSSTYKIEDILKDTSPATLAQLAKYGVDISKITVVDDDKDKAIKESLKSGAYENDGAFEAILAAEPSEEILKYLLVTKAEVITAPESLAKIVPAATKYLKDNANNSEVDGSTYKAAYKLVYSGEKAAKPPVEVWAKYNEMVEFDPVAFQKMAPTPAEAVKYLDAYGLIDLVDVSAENVSAQEHIVAAGKLSKHADVLNRALALEIAIKEYKSTLTPPVEYTDEQKKDDLIGRAKAMVAILNDTSASKLEQYSAVANIIGDQEIIAAAYPPTPAANGGDAETPNPAIATFKNHFGRLAYELGEFGVIDEEDEAVMAKLSLEQQKFIRIYTNAKEKNPPSSADLRYLRANIGAIGKEAIYKLAQQKDACYNFQKVALLSSLGLGVAAEILEAPEGKTAPIDKALSDIYRTDASTTEGKAKVEVMVKNIFTGLDLKNLRVDYANEVAKLGMEHGQQEEVKKWLKGDNRVSVGTVDEILTQYPDSFTPQERFDVALNCDSMSDTTLTTWLQNDVTFTQDQIFTLLNSYSKDQYKQIITALLGGKKITGTPGKLTSKQITDLLLEHAEDTKSIATTPAQITTLFASLGVAPEYMDLTTLAASKSFTPETAKSLVELANKLLEPGAILRLQLEGTLTPELATELVKYNGKVSLGDIDAVPLETIKIFVAHKNLSFKGETWAKIIGSYAWEGYEKFDENKAADYNSIIAQDIKDLDLYFNGVDIPEYSNDETKARESFAKWVYSIAYRYEIAPYKGMLKDFGFQKGADVNYSNAVDGKTWDNIQAQNPADFKELSKVEAGFQSTVATIKGRITELGMGDPDKYMTY